MKISVCIPCYNSAKTLPMVINEIKEEFDNREEYDYQIVLVNDGSPDNTFNIIKNLCDNDKKITGINFSKNQGQAIARMAALNYATGDALVCMDDDGQHPAHGIFLLIEKLNNGYDIVYARFPQKKHSLFKITTSKLKKKIAEKTGNKVKGIDTSPFFALSKFSINAIKHYHSPFPSPGAFLREVTDKVTDVDIEHRARAEGKSNYNLKKLFNLWLNGFTNFSIIPLRLASYCGIFCAILGFTGAIYIVVRKLLNPDITTGYTSIITSIFFVSGIIMIMLGIIGEYIGRMYMILSNKPQFIVSETINDAEDNEETFSE